MFGPDDRHRDLIKRLVHERPLPSVLEVGVDCSPRQCLCFFHREVELDALPGHHFLEHLWGLELDARVAAAHDASVTGVAVRDASVAVS